jgi:hypothetical protein
MDPNARCGQKMDHPSAVEGAGEAHVLETEGVRMTTTTQTRYDFGRCTVEHVDRNDCTVPHWGTTLDSPVLAMSKSGVVIRVAQSWYDRSDEAQFTLFDFDARALAEKILEALGDE